MPKSARKTMKARPKKDYDVHHNMPIGECCEATFHGIHEWYKRMFEHLGWMILAHKRGMVDKTTVYLTSLKRLKMAIEQKLKTTKDSDKKTDLKIMWENVCTLMEHAEKDLGM
jgi:predicted ATP-binding protein involved in virulence